MNPNWKNFLHTENALFDAAALAALPNESDRHIYPLTHLAVLTVSGNDAAKLLQGQITCNVNDISEQQSSLGALCNPKGKVIATFCWSRKRMPSLWFCLKNCSKP